MQGLDNLPDGREVGLLQMNILQCSHLTSTSQKLHKQDYEFCPYLHSPSVEAMASQQPAHVPSDRHEKEVTAVNTHIKRITTSFDPPTLKALHGVILYNNLTCVSRACSRSPSACLPFLSIGPCPQRAAGPAWSPAGRGTCLSVASWTSARQRECRRQGRSSRWGRRPEPKGMGSDIKW